MAASTSENLPSSDLKPGTFSPPLPTDLRSPCPAINALANHGYIPRSASILSPYLDGDTFEPNPLLAWPLRNAQSGRDGSKTGEWVLNLDQLAQHGIVEHDVSLSRRDIAQGDNNSPQPDLIAELLAASTDGRFLTVPDFVALRRKRYATQKQDNPDLKFGSAELQLASAEVALILQVFGDGKKVPVEYVKAFFQEGRLPR
ncbi:MAG: hypothetical protein Q9167_002444 [Letrouitia subvulpina]